MTETLDISFKNYCVNSSKQYIKTKLNLKTNNKMIDRQMPFYMYLMHLDCKKYN